MEINRTLYNLHKMGHSPSEIKTSAGNFSCDANYLSIILKLHIFEI